jgi:glyoxylase-like metal-dependent hydrolase (beta-lactamase superfamily II)
MPKIFELLDGVPIASNQGHIAFCSVLLIEGEDKTGNTKRIIVDTAHGGRRIFLVDALAAHGLTTQDIDYVFCTHAHWDHMQNNDLFTQAKVLIHPDERKYAHDPSVDDWATPSWTGYVLEQLEIEEVADGHEIIPGVKVMEMIGHTIGSMGVSVETDSGLAIATSDAIHIGSVAVSGINPLVFWDEKHASESIRRVLARADIVFPGHDAPFRPLKDGTIEYERTIEIAVAGITPTVLPVDAVMPATMMPGRHDQAAAKARLEMADQLIGDRQRVARRYRVGQHPMPSKSWDFA